MRTEELMREYQSKQMPIPEDGWQKLVFLAAELVKTAKKMRNTLRKRPHKESVPPLFVQSELFEEEN